MKNPIWGAGGGGQEALEFYLSDGSTEFMY